MSGTGHCARRVEIAGRVQGVSFRVATEAQARRLGVVGWVANRPDGAVIAHFEGPSPAVEQMLAWCHEGPSRARVDDVRVVEVPPTGASAFEIRARPDGA